MERRVLLERLSKQPHGNIVRMYHAFSDYTCLYYLMDLHVRWGDLWNELRYRNPAENDTDGNNKVMLACHRSQAVVWMHELVAAVEHMHRHGIVHRDLKAENVLLTRSGHVVVIDFGTAKDLIETDLNGPEFVGTPDFMPPEAVAGASSMEEAKIAASRGDVGADHAADLWALGAVLFVLQTGTTPFWSVSPYMAFLKIKRCLLTRPVGIVDDDTWDLITKLMKFNPADRLGADAFELRVDKVNKNGGTTTKRTMVERSSNGYDVIRQHAYFKSLYDHPNNHKNDDGNDGNDEDHRRLLLRKSVITTTPIPTLRDLCVRPLAERVRRDAANFKLCDRHPPGDGSRYDVLRLPEDRDRRAVLHVLDRCQLLTADSRVYGRFFADAVAAKLGSKIRSDTRDYVGLTQLNDNEGKPPAAKMNDPHVTPEIEIDRIELVHLFNPLFVYGSTNDKTNNDNNQGNADDAAAAAAAAAEREQGQRKVYLKQLKRSIAVINRTRPRLVVVTGRRVDDKCKKLLARVSETIPVVVHTGEAFFTFWKMGIQCVAVSSSHSATAAADDEQVLWLRMLLEQSRMSKHPVFVFTDDDPKRLPITLKKRLARGRVLMLSGMMTGAMTTATATTARTERPPTTTLTDSSPYCYSSQVTYTHNEMIPVNNEECDDTNNENNNATDRSSSSSVVSIRSTDSEEDEKDDFTMQVKAYGESGLLRIVVHPEPDQWETQFERIE